jgi:hypothetical protein
VTPLALTIAALVAVTPARAEQLAGHFAAAAQAEHVGAHWLVALAYHESSMRHTAVSRRGARGLLQLMPLWGVYRDEAQHVAVAARVLRLYRARCGTMVRALTAYRVGHCAGVGPRAVATARLARMVRARLERPSANRLRAPVLR